MEDKENKPISCGILVKCGKRYLVVHATKTWAPLKVDDGYWGFPKGQLDEDEHPKECAIRELEEETGINLRHKKFQTQLLNVYEGEKKNFILYQYVDTDMELMNHIFECNSLTPSIDNVTGFPEVDAWYWATKKELKDLLHGVHVKNVLPSKKQRKAIVEKYDKTNFKEIVMGETRTDDD